MTRPGRQPEPGMADLRARFARDGFLIVPRLFSRRTTDAIRREIQRVVARLRAEARVRGDGPPQFDATGVLIDAAPHSALLRRLACDPRPLRLLHAIHAGAGAFWGDRIVLKSETIPWSTPWHQDWRYWRGAHKLTVWIALDDVDEENGCLRLVPGSHHRLVRHDAPMPPMESFRHRVDPRAVERRRTVAAPLAAGGAVVFHDLLLHASLPNRTGAERWAWLPTYASMASSATGARRDSRRREA